ncbi:MAG: alpha/beta hydrolase [Nitratireductor sp.]|nr:alpha/beta hydrolase [Nitratireductor sp.]
MDAVKHETSERGDAHSNEDAENFGSDSYLAELEGFPMPPNPHAGKTRTWDGIDLRYAWWRTTRPPFKGTVLLLNGRAEYIEKLYETIEFLRDKGFDVLTFDWRGQGGSSRILEDPRRGFVENFEHYVTDLETVMTNVALPDCRAPFFILAHSTGALVALLAAPRFGNRIRRMVLGSPFLGLGKAGLSQGIVKWLSGTMHVLGLGETYVAGGATPDENRAFAGNRLTQDSVRFRRNSEFAGKFRNLTIGGPTASWIFAALRAMERVLDPDFHNAITIPTLMVCAGNDEVVDNRTTEELGRFLRSGTTLTIPGARHELLQERDVYREQFLAAFLSFVPGTGMNKPAERLEPGRRPLELSLPGSARPAQEAKAIPSQRLNRDISARKDEPDHR